MSIFSKLFGSRKFETSSIDEMVSSSTGEDQKQNTSKGEKESRIFENADSQIINFMKEELPFTPNDIPEGIRFIVETQGKNYLLSKGFINILNDYHLLKDLKAVKSVLLNIQQDGFMEELINTDSFQLSASSIKKKIVSDYGVKETIASYAVDSIGYGLSLVEFKPILEEQQTSSPVKEEVNPMKMKNDPITSVSTQTLPYDPKRDIENYRYPTLDLLRRYDDDGNPYIDMAEQTENKNSIVDVLRTLGVEVSTIRALVGPSVTLYEMTLAPGVRLTRIRNNEQTIAIRLAKQCRIIAPIPGKGTIGIELPNLRPAIVSMLSLVNSKKYQESTLDLPCLIGKSIDNEIVLHDLTIENLLIAGAMGQGLKSILDSILLSLLFKRHPVEMKFVLIDPTGSFFNVYRKLDKHFLAAIDTYMDDPIISSVTSAVETLNSLCIEMEARLQLLRSAVVRNISEYNQKFVSRFLDPWKGHKYMPRIVLAIAEYADFLAFTGTEFEQLITRLAQRGKIVGIHIIMATEQPTNKVVSPSIKMNFPSRIALRVASHLDSATILEQHGAEKLIGNGDALYSKGLSLTRIQSPFNDEIEIDEVCRFISYQQGYLEPYELPNPNPEPEPTYDIDMNHLDPLFEDAARLIVMSQSGSTSLVQRKFAIGYNRAGRLMDQLEKAGIVGAAHGSAPRDVLIQNESSLELILSKFR